LDSSGGFVQVVYLLRFGKEKSIFLDHCQTPVKTPVRAFKYFHHSIQVLRLFLAYCFYHEGPVPLSFWIDVGYREISPLNRLTSRPIDGHTSVI
jgi:hypothetical protein